MISIKCFSREKTDVSLKVHLRHKNKSTGAISSDNFAEREWGETFNASHFTVTVKAISKTSKHDGGSPSIIVSKN